MLITAVWRKTAEAIGSRTTGHYWLKEVMVMLMVILTIGVHLWQRRGRRNKSGATSTNHPTVKDRVALVGGQRSRTAGAGPSA